jgi:hypothetical protein
VICLGGVGLEHRIARNFSELRMLFSQAFHIACNDPAEFNLLKITMKGIISRRQASNDPNSSVNGIY